MISLEYLVNFGYSIKEGLKYVPLESGTSSSSSVYKLEDSIAYSTWKNQAILFIKEVLKDKDILNRFIEESEKFEKNYYEPVYLDNMIGILNAYLLSGIGGTVKFEEKAQRSKRNVFLVCSHSRPSVIYEVELTIRRFGLHPILKNQQGNYGRTIFDKIENNAEDVGFAVIVLTDDEKIVGENAFRTQQNVIFEMGFFMGLLGRENVVCLVQNNVRIPEDLSGLLYIVLDNARLWQYSLAKELKARGYEIDLNQIF